MTTVDLLFPILGTQPIPADHGYHLYSALSHQLDAIHSENGVGIHPIRGQQLGNRLIALTPSSRLALRTTDDKLAALIKLAGKQLNLAGRTLRIGVPQVYSLTPAPALRSRLVTTKNGLDQSRFEQELRRQLDVLGISSEAILTIGKRRTLRIHDKEVVGYEVILVGLTAEESLTLQERGLGGRRHMGCGIFVPWQPEGEPQ
jgi:CRISPR-associated protein Cas6